MKVNPGPQKLFSFFTAKALRRKEREIIHLNFIVLVVKELIGMDADYKS